MKNPVTLFYVFLLCTSLQAQYDYTYYSCGSLLSDALDTDAGVRSPYVSAYNEDGSLRWMQHDPAGLAGRATTLSYDYSSREATVGGVFRDTLHLFGQTLIAPSSVNNGFIIRCNAVGEALFVKTIPTEKVSYISSVFSSGTISYASGYAKGNAQDKIDLDILTTERTALLFKLDSEGETLWMTKAEGSNFGGRVIEYEGSLYWQGCAKNPEVENAYYTWIKKIDPENGETLWEIQNKAYFLHDDLPHSEMALSVTDGKLISAQVQAIAITDPVTEGISWEKQLVISCYDIETQTLLYQNKLASTAGLYNTGFSGHSRLALKDMEVLPDGSIHMVGNFKQGEMSIYDKYGDAYTEVAQTGTDSWLMKLDAQGHWVQTNWYAGTGHNFTNCLATDGSRISQSGCFYKDLEMADSSFQGYPDKAKLFHVWYGTLPTQKATSEASNEPAEAVATEELILSPNLVEGGSSVQLSYPLETGIYYEVSLHDQNGNIISEKLMSFTFSQATENAITLPIPPLTTGMYLVTLKGNGEVKSTGKLIIR